MERTPKSWQTLSQMRRSSQSAESRTTVWKSCGSSRRAVIAEVTSAMFLASGNLAVSISPRPSSVWTKMGLGADALKRLLPTPSWPYTNRRGGRFSLPLVMVLSNDMVVFSLWVKVKR